MRPHAVAAACAQAIFAGVAAAARYPNNGANEDEDYPELSSSNGTSSSSLAANSGLASSNGSSAARMSDAGYQAAREEQFDVEEQRKELLTLFKNTAKLAFPEALQFAAAKLQGVLASAGSSTAAAAAASGLANGLGSAAGGSKSGAAGSSSSGRGKFQETELAVTLVYELGEGAPEEALKPGSGGLAQLVMLLLDQAAALPAGQHRLVALAVLETCVRYCKLLQHNQGSIPGVLGLFLGARGLGHPSPTVATRAAYLLSRLVKTLRGNLRQYAGDILQQLQPYLEVVATRPPPSNAAAVGTSREAAAGRAPVTAAVVDDRLYVFESVGLLLGQEELQADQQLAALQQLLQPLTRQIEANLGPAAAEAAGGSSSGSSSWAILQSLEAIARLNKGFKWELCTRSRPQIGARQSHSCCLLNTAACFHAERMQPSTARRAAQALLSLRCRPACTCTCAFLLLTLILSSHPLSSSLSTGAAFISCLEVSLAVPQTLPGNKQLRGRFIAFLHRMVESLMSAVLPYLPPALEALMGSGADVADMSDVLALMVQLVQRFKEALAKLVEAALPVAVVKVHTLLGGLLLLARRPVLACCVLQKGSAAHANALLPSFMQGA
jgi:exportin-T